jgi:hypothetical protein
VFTTSCCYCYYCKLHPNTEGHGTHPCTSIRSLREPNQLPTMNSVATLMTSHLHQTSPRAKPASNKYRDNNVPTTTHGANPNTAESKVQCENSNNVPMQLCGDRLHHSRLIFVRCQVESIHTRELRSAGKTGLCQLSAHCTFSVWTQFTVSTGKKSELPRGMPLVTRAFASSEHAWDPMASSSVNFCRKTRTVPSVGVRLK